MKKLDKEDIRDKKKGKYSKKEEKAESGSLGAIRKQLKAQGAIKSRRRFFSGGK